MNMRKPGDPRMQNNLVVNLSMDLAFQILEYSSKLKQLRHFEIASQLLRSGTSVGANIWESQQAESAPDFVHKLKIAAKECNETDFWLCLCEKLPEVPVPPDLYEINNRVGMVLNKIIATSKERVKKNREAKNG